MAGFVPIKEVLIPVTEGAILSNLYRKSPHLWAAITWRILNGLAPDHLHTLWLLLNYVLTQFAYHTLGMVPLAAGKVEQRPFSHSKKTPSNFKWL